MKESYYDILEIQENAGEEQIKKGYILQLRKYPNEKYPEEFKAIRNAYEVLSDPISRNEYDLMTVHGKEIEVLSLEAEKSALKEDYASAAMFYKKILIIVPSLMNIRNKYAVALINSNNEDKAIIQLEKLIKLDDTNAVYFFNLGLAYEKIDKEYLAIENYKKALILDSNNINILFAISDVYVTLRDYKSAKMIMEDVINQNVEDNFHNFVFLFKQLKIDVFAKDINSFLQTFKRIEKLLSIHPSEKKYAAIEFGKFASKLFEYNAFEWAHYVTEKGIELNPEDIYLANLLEETNNKKNLYEEFNSLHSDKKIIGPIRHSMYLFLFKDDYEESKFNESLEKMHEDLETAYIYDPIETLKTIKRIKVIYPNTYKKREDFFGTIQTLSKESKEREEQYSECLKDRLIVNSLKRLVSLYLSSVEEKERLNYFEDILDEMGDEHPTAIIDSINRLSISYPRLFALNSEYFTKLKSSLC
ncbi:DnaJ domain-containing protein [Psychrobacillus sp. NPDC093180]|uniref:J domain-containing protein n=1 Tax=Psychrobacillus sp. NPDC093180 TaxID=3364489 RepID=UPI003811184D